jgi:hypothetical protein
MLAHITDLVNEGNLIFACNHRTSQKYYLERGKNDFLAHVEVGLRYHDRYSKYVFEDCYCFECGKTVRYRLEDNKLVPNKEECFRQSEVVVDINVPSGNLIFADWLKYGREVLEYLDDDGESINCTKGIVQRIDRYATENVLHVFVGNTCPSIYMKDGVLSVGNNAYDEDDNEIPLVPGGNNIGSVCTDLWWVTAIDRSIYESMLAAAYGEDEVENKIAEVIKDADVVTKVEPGMYRCRYNTKSSDDGESRLYVTMERLVH